MNDNKVVNRGVGYLIMSVQDAGHKLDFYDTAWVSDTDIIHRIIKSGCDILMVSFSSVYFERMKSIVRRIKKIIALPVVVGGIHATIAPNVVMSCSDVDYICVGEGEKFVIEFLNKFGSDDLLVIDNLGWRDSSGKAYFNLVKTPTDLSRLKPFRYSTFHPKSVIPDGQVIPGLSYVFATRGCPYRCTYCCNDSWLDLYGRNFIRMHSIDDTIAELLDLKLRYRAKFLYFGDEMILFNKAYYTELFTRVQDEVGLSYGCMARVETITSSVVNLFRETGCRYVGMGIECGDEEFRRKWLNRKMTNDQIRNSFAVLRAISGMRLTSYNMKGWPVTYDSQLTEATARLNDSISPDWIQTTWFCPFPKTSLGDYCYYYKLVDVDKLGSTGSLFSQSFLKDIPDGLPTLTEYLSSC